MMLEIINKKRLNQILTEKEIKEVVNSYNDGTIPDYQMSSLLMAICINGMTMEETYHFTKALIDSGEKIDLSMFGNALVDKHSTGGVGDKITFTALPIAAACGVKIAKMSGRGLGHTGGTIDKLESIKGFQVNLDLDTLIQGIDKVGMALTTTSAKLVPADKKIYALRDVSGTVSSIPLIAASIMSKKIAMGSQNILIDVKVGSGALINSIEDAELLGNTMIEIGKRFKVHVHVIISNMDYPLGNCIGNGLEVIEALKILKGEGNVQLRNLSILIASHLISMSKNIDIEMATKEANDAVNQGTAYQKFLEFIQFQGGDINQIAIADTHYEVIADKTGFISHIDAKMIGDIVVSLGAGKRTKEDTIDYGVGIVLHKSMGDSVKQGDVLATVYSNKDVKEKVLAAFQIEETRTKPLPLIYKIID